jgi:DNA polymerase V
MSCFALADCNNFFVSCERVFNPALEKKPVVIMSSNDGCIISRSNEAKRLGIPMGAPVFKYRSIIRQQQIICLSSNYALYADMSQRVMNSLQSLCSALEIYSIDEAFLKLDDFFCDDLVAYLHKVRQKIKQWTGIPISIGLATTKTLAKAANLYAKRVDAGIYDLRTPHVRDKVLKSLLLHEVWGVGQKLAAKLQTYSIKTAFDLSQANARMLRQCLSLAIERTMLELNGVSCCETMDIQPQKRIICSRSFGQPVAQLQDLHEAISTYTARAARKLRKLAAKTKSLYVFLTTNKNKTGEYAVKGLFCSLPAPTNDTRELIAAAKQTLKKIYRNEFYYKKAGILFMELTEQYHQTDFFIDPTYSLKSEVLMRAVDGINKICGLNVLFFAAEGIQRPWLTRSEYCTPRYTTEWKELVKVIAH